MHIDGRAIFETAIFGMDLRGNSVDFAKDALTRVRLKLQGCNDVYHKHLGSNIDNPRVPTCSMRGW